MRLFRGITPASRLSFALGTITVSLLLAAGAIGLMPDEGALLGPARLRVAEAIGLQLSMFVDQDRADALEPLGAALLERHPDLVSMKVSSTDGEVAWASDGHAARWNERRAVSGPPTHVELPIYENDEIWGTAQLRFRGRSAFWWLTPTLRMVLFVSLLGFVAFRLYLRRVLRHLDPSAVIPERVKTMLDTMTEGVMILDRRERIVLANRAFADVTGLSFKELMGRRASEFPWIRPDGVELPWTGDVTEGLDARGVELRLPRPDGRDDQVFMVNATPILSVDGVCRGTLATFDNVTAIEEKNLRLEQMLAELNAVQSRVQRQNEELKVLATRDALTQCLNRRALFEQLEQEWDGAGRYGYPLSCIMLDIDHFKSINDSHGHAAGDQVLERVGRIIRDSLRTRDCAGRYGGEEFCVVLPHVDAAQAAAAAEKLRTTIESTLVAGISVTSSFGVASTVLEPSSPQELVDLADQALYAAKHGGRNRVVRRDEITEVPRPESDEPRGDATSATEEIDRMPALDDAISFHAVVALMSALAQRDPATAAHCRRVADLCMITADGLMSVRDRFMLEVAAMLHDIGKIGVPDSVLLKPEPLTPEEWEVMERHDRIGIEIINSAFHCPELTNIVRNHHAFFDGDARDPSLPRGHDIPLRARILSIADAYDAIVSDRVYREGRPAADAFAELRRCAGTQFDPDLIERFISAVTARDAGTPAEPMSDSAELLLDLGLAIERLGAALDSGDLRSVIALSEHLALVATKCGRPEIADTAARLAHLTETENDIESALTTTRDLLDLCRQASETVTRADDDASVETGADPTA